MMEWDVTKPWYHGSPAKLTWLQVGSTITQDRDLARIFSHKPSMVSQDVDAAGKYTIKHNGRQPGYLYRLVKPIAQADIGPHPTSTMGDGQEWLTRHELEVELVEPTIINAEESLSAADIIDLHKRAQVGS